jgi:putative chitinase
MGNVGSNDGYNFRGRGFIQITGRENYTKLSNDTDIDFINNPDLLLTEANALLSALWYWNKNGLNRFADKDDVITITKRINGGTIGLNDRIKKVNKWKQLIK